MKWKYPLCAENLYWILHAEDSECYKSSRENYFAHNLFLTCQTILKCSTGHGRDTTGLCSKLQTDLINDVNAPNTRRTPDGSYILDAIGGAKALIGFDHIYRPSRDPTLIPALPCWQYFHIRLSVCLPSWCPDRRHCNRKVERPASTNTPEVRFLSVAEQRVSQ